MKKVLPVLALTLLFTLNVCAAPESNPELLPEARVVPNQVAKARHIANTWATMMENGATTFTEFEYATHFGKEWRKLHRFPVNQPIPPGITEADTKLRAVLESYTPEFKAKAANIINAADFTNYMASRYAAKFSSRELDELASFYSTATGIQLAQFGSRIFNFLYLGFTTIANPDMKKRYLALPQGNDRQEAMNRVTEIIEAAQMTGFFAQVERSSFEAVAFALTAAVARDGAEADKLGRFLTADEIAKIKQFQASSVGHKERGFAIMVAQDYWKTPRLRQLDTDYNAFVKAHENEWRSLLQSEQE